MHSVIYIIGFVPLALNQIRCSISSSAMADEVNKETIGIKLYASNRELEHYF
ncbi:hypothetical protein HanIR_Chr11g0547471 [Helianthus annuus]|nr:hypothetical protein HanIR_Chr11g0547471 [Helianthus annuus]